MKALGVLGAACAALLLFAASIPAEPPPTDAAQIESLRREIGLSSLPTGNDNAPEFREALERVIQANASNDSPSDLAPGVLPESAAPESNADLELVASLRAVGRQLDEKSANLEDERRFTAADRLRRLAHTLRRTARKLEE